MSDPLRQKAGIVMEGITTDGKKIALLVNSDGSLVAAGSGSSSTGVPTALGAKPSTSTASPSRFANLGANATLNVKAATGNVFSLYCYNANAATRYLQLHNTATVPSSSDVPLYSFPVYAGLFTLIGEDFFSSAGANFSAGIAFAFSTTKDTYTAGTNTDQSTVIHYK